MEKETYTLTVGQRTALDYLPGDRIRHTSWGNRDAKPDPNSVRRIVKDNVDFSTLLIVKVVRPSRGYARHVRRAKAQGRRP